MEKDVATVEKLEGLFHLPYDSLKSNDFYHQKHLTKRLSLNLLMLKSKLKGSRTNWMMHLVPKTWSYD